MKYALTILVALIATGCATRKSAWDGYFVQVEVWSPLGGKNLVTMRGPDAEQYAKAMRLEQDISKWYVAPEDRYESRKAFEAVYGPGSSVPQAQYRLPAPVSTSNYDRQKLNAMLEQNRLQAEANNQRDLELIWPRRR